MPKFERIASPNDKYNGKIKFKNGKEPKSMAVIHCTGSLKKDMLPVHFFHRLPPKQNGQRNNSWDTVLRKKPGWDGMVGKLQTYIPTKQSCLAKRSLIKNEEIINIVTISSKSTFG